MAYTKNIAVIRGLKSGFSADGGPLSGIIKAEKYGSSLKVEASFINFAPLTEGRYVCALSDGKNICVLDGTNFEGTSEVDTSAGFAALVCFVNGGVLPVASAICGQFQSAVIGIKEQIERLENIKEPHAKAEPAYEDEALAEENYYEYEQAFKDSEPVRENKKKEKERKVARKNETVVSSFEKEGAGGLAHGSGFYPRMKDEIEKVLSSYPEESALVGTVENSRWVRITYGDGKFYVFGVIYGADKPLYICYGVPSSDSRRPPESMVGLASFIPSSPEGSAEGYWVMYQDADTGASVKISAH